MKVKIKETGEVVDVKSLQVRKEVQTSSGISHLEAFLPLHKVELVPDEPKIDWGQRKFELVKAATEGLLSNSYWMELKRKVADKSYSSPHEKAAFLRKDIAEDILEFATAVLIESRQEDVE